MGMWFLDLVSKGGKRGMKITRMMYRQWYKEDVAKNERKNREEVTLMSLRLMEIACGRLKSMGGEEAVSLGKDI